ncbi:MAG: TIGR01777 family oxidoreductase [Sciscionella sp.]
MRIAIAGSSGLIGSALVAALRRAGHDVRLLVRREPASAGEHRWEPPAGTIDEGALQGVDAVVNLCGAALAAARWTHARKQIIVDSRIEPTEVLAEAVARLGIGTLLNASAVGYYGDTGDTVVTEAAPSGHGFLARLCRDWEAATTQAHDAGSRVVSLRIGPVLSAEGGLLAQLRPLFMLALGGRLGDGKQYLPWISQQDAIGAIRFLIEAGDVSGPVNLAAPAAVTNAEFTIALAQVLGRPAPWRVPAIALRTLFGELADDALLSGQRAVPEVLRDSGFTFRDSTLRGALHSVLAR